MANNLIDAVKQSLCSYLEAEMPSIEQAIDDFPNPSENLVYPSATVFTSSPRYTSRDPYVASKGAKIVGGADDGKTPVRYVVGSYEFSLQVDLWTAYKAQRPDLYEEFFRAINKQMTPMGLSLPLTDYYGSIAHYHITGLAFIDTEGDSQRQDWRCKVDVICTVNHVFEKLEFVIETIENNTTITEETIPDDPITVEVEII